MSHQMHDSEDSLPESDQLEKDTSYSPGSETETQEKQETSTERVDEVDGHVDHDIDADQVNVRPGTGGPDDVGDIDVDVDDINFPSAEEASRAAPSDDAATN
ncbi:hypothetical protein [Pseudoclavibacter sp. RFBB5]|uniref:hypothetical protein n=1 Tax=Pseudoclavibacter sp. RFBB5 TaxID=2080574 RepID=UPI000CE7B513|nr:hypothetical protein [Pseudoclavibacter sp. RFBB5]PPG33243.1 hypothetical protein C5B97_01080 [Pseudoclavibacter sp. RFBB5]